MWKMVELVEKEIISKMIKDIRKAGETQEKSKRSCIRKSSKRRQSTKREK